MLQARLTPNFRLPTPLPRDISPGLSNCLRLPPTPTSSTSILSHLCSGERSPSQSGLPPLHLLLHTCAMSKASCFTFRAYPSQPFSPPPLLPPGLSPGPRAGPNVLSPQGPLTLVPGHTGGFPFKVLPDLFPGCPSNPTATHLPPSPPSSPRAQVTHAEASLDRPTQGINSIPTLVVSTLDTKMSDPCVPG